MDDLVQFLRDRYDEDEQEAAAASPGPWHVDAEADEVLAVDDIVVAEGFALSGQQLRATTRHIARHDPARVLREVETKRRILAEIVPEVEKSEEMIEDEWHTRTDITGDLVRLLALPYSGHPDYQDAWRP